MNLSKIFEKTLKSYPDKKAVIVEDEILTYSQLNKEANRVANFLRNIGIKKGDKVGFFMENKAFIIEGYIGCFKVGAAAVPASYYTAEGELIHEANSCGVRVYFISERFVPLLKNVRDKIKTLEKVVVVDGKGNNFLSWENIKETISTDEVSIEVEEDLPLMILYTSGSTGFPKGVTHTAKSIMASAVGRAKTLRHSENDVMLTTSFLCHGAAPLIVLFPMLYVGGTSIFIQKFYPKKFLKLLMENKVTHVAAAPMEWQDFLELKDIPSLPDLKYATTGGYAVSKELRKKFRDIMGIPLISSLGMTECGGYMTIPPHIPPNDESVGMPIYGVEVKLVDENFSEVKTGEIGEIVVKGDTVMCYYYNDEESTKKVFKDGWFKTGDLGRVDEKGYYYFEGRKKRIIIRGGGNINPVEVESQLKKHPEVKDAIVVGVKDEILGEEVFAFIILKERNKSPQKDEIRNFLKNKISDRKIPRYIEFIKEFPIKEKTKKIDYKKLEKMAQKIVNERR